MYATSYSSYLESKGARYEKDPEWIDTKKILLKYFKDKEVSSKALSKVRYSKLLILREDKDVDFEGYAKWYWNDKYKAKGFAWGLFLYDGMIEEYKNASKGIRKVQQHLRTSSDAQKSVHNAQAKKDKEKLRGMLE